ncbi:purine-cytosine permease family protein [Aliamphritea ceti]|uniref:purine-cytosine permease family protein n=1 Tax=Aliamphritea ceti TaxID=1524258 RepID=UPI0021C3B2FD|nr:cytosine permease [Aliamphritea ceti]
MSLGISEDNITPIQSSEKKLGVVGTFFLWVAATLVVPTVMTGQMFIPDVAPLEAFEILVIASIVGCVALAAMSLIGTRTGLPTLVVARGTFGYGGAKIIAVLNVIILGGWCFIQGYLGALALNQIFVGLLGFDNILLALFVTSGIVIVITILGHTGIQKIEGLASTAMIVVALFVIYMILDKYEINSLYTFEVSSSPALTYAIIFDIVLATAFSWIALTCDHNRYCKNSTTGVVGVVSGYMIGTILAMGIGITVGAFSIIDGMEPTYDPAVLLGGGVGLIAAFVMFLSAVSTNIMATYSCIMSTMSVVPKASYTKVAILIGLFCASGAFLQEILMASFFDWVLLVGALFIPVFSIMLADYFFVKKSDFNVDELVKSSNSTLYRYTNGFNVKAIIVYFIGAAMSFYFTYVNPLEFGATALSFVATGILYIVVSNLFKAPVLSGVEPAK